MSKFKKLKKGAVLSETQYYVVDKVVGNKAQLVNDSGENIVVDSNYVDSCLNCASHYLREEKVNKTTAADILLKSANTALTVCYKKQVDHTEVEKEIVEAYSNATPKAFPTAVKSALKRVLEGEERVIVGRHKGELNELGRINFIDMENKKDPSKSYDTRTRQVDPRTIQWLIVNDVKYVVK